MLIVTISKAMLVLIEEDVELVVGLEGVEVEVGASVGASVGVGGEVVGAEVGAEVEVEGEVEVSFSP